MMTVPTKGNLISKKRSLELAKSGFELMDRKRNILIRELMALIDTAEEIQSQIDSTFSSAYRSLRVANITLGFMDSIAATVPVDRSVEIKYRSIMGVEIPSVAVSDLPPKVPYGFQDTNSSLDDAFLKFHKVKQLCLKLSEVETTIYLLASNIKTVQKRANALNNIIIPRFSEEVKFITEALEEKEREEFARLKVIKSRKEK